MLISNLKLKIRTAEESERKEVKYLNALLGIVGGSFISVIINSGYLLVIKKESELWPVFITGLLGQAILFLGLYWNKLLAKKIEKLKKELAGWKREIYLQG